MSTPHTDSKLPPLERSARARRATVNDVAMLAGVSAMTVSRAVNKPDQVPAATLEKVRKAIAATGYVPNLLAGGLRSNKSRLVAAVIPTLSGPVFLETVESLTASLAAKGYQLMLGQSGYHASREDDLLGAIIGRRPDGIILTGVLHTDEGRQRLVASGIPIVETWDLTPDPLDMLVGFSHVGVGRAVCEFLHDRGRRRIALILGDDERARRRHAAFAERARELGLGDPAVERVPSPTTLASGRGGLRTLLERDPAIDAVFCSSDLLALGVLIEAQVRGVTVPDRLAVMGFGDMSMASDVHPALTTVRIDGWRIGREAAQFIVDRAEGRHVAERVVDVGFSIVERDSV